MANELGRTVIHRYMYARSWALGDRKSPSTTTPCLVGLAGDCETDSQITPFNASTNNEIPQTLTLSANLPLSPPEFAENLPIYSTKIGHVLPPSLDEADAGEPAGSGGLLPISWQRLNHDTSLLNLEFEPSVVVLVDAVQLASQQRKLVDALIAIKHKFPGALVWTPGIGGPDNLAVLTWFGVDIFDLARSRQCTAANFILTSNGPRKPVPQSGEDTDLESQVVHWQLAISEVKARLADGTLRTLVEQQAINSPKLVEHLRYHDKLARYNSDVGISHVPKDTILHCNSHTSLSNPVVTKWTDFMIEQYQPPEGLDNVLLLLPCSAKKPYRMSKSHRKFLDAVGHSAFHEMMVTSPLGLVPRDLEETWPASHYDIPVTGEWSFDEIHRTRNMLDSLIKNNNYHTVINHSSMSFELPGIRYYETRVGNSATSREALEKLREVVSTVSKEHAFRNRKHHKILLDNFSSVARYKMENDKWLDDVTIRGKPPFWRIEHHGKQIALWSNDRRGFSLAKSSIPLISANSSLKKIHLKSNISWKGDIFSSIIESYDLGIISGDDLLVMQDNLPVGLARATASGWEWSTTPGMIAKGHQRL